MLRFVAAHVGYGIALWNLIPTKGYMVMDDKDQYWHHTYKLHCFQKSGLLFPSLFHTTKDADVHRDILLGNDYCNKQALVYGWGITHFAPFVDLPRSMTAKFTFVVKQISDQEWKALREMEKIN